MKRKIVLFLLLSASVMSCSKNGDVNTTPVVNSIQEDSLHKLTAKAPKQFNTLSEDEDRKIVIRTKKANGTPVKDAIINLSNGSVSIERLSDSLGQADFIIDWLTSWTVKIEHPVYLTVETTIPGDSSLEHTFYLELR